MSQVLVFLTDYCLGHQVHQWHSKSHLSLHEKEIKNIQFSKHKLVAELVVPLLTFFQLVLHHHQEGDAYHEEVKAKTDFTELSHSSSTHLPHYILIGLLSADGRRITQDDQTADEEYQRHLQRKTMKSSTQIHTWCHSRLKILNLWPWTHLWMVYHSLFSQNYLIFHSN